MTLLNKPAERHQADMKQDEYSELSGLIFGDSRESRDVTRQEYRDDVEVNLQLKRYGVHVPIRQGGEFTERDYTLDLQQAIYSTEQAHNTWLHLPREIRQKYPTWKHMLDGMANGHLGADMEAYKASREERLEKFKAAKQSAEQEAKKSKKEDTSS